MNIHNVIITSLRGADSRGLSSVQLHTAQQTYDLLEGRGAGAPHRADLQQQPCPALRCSGAMPMMYIYLLCHLCE